MSGFAGRYCPVGTPVGSDIRCPAGTYGVSTDLTAAEDCTPCPAGSYCSGGASSAAITGSCRAGYYCPIGTVSATSFPCPAGTYSSATDLYDASQCIACDPGEYFVGFSFVLDMVTYICTPPLMHHQAISVPLDLLE